MLNVFSEPIKPRTRFAIVLDIDETLVHTLRDDEKLEENGLESYEFNVIDAATPVGTGVITHIKGCKRNYLDEFLKEALKTFKYVIIWSAGRPKYVREIIKHIFKDIGYPHAIFTFDDCEDLNSIIVKPLSKVAKILNIDVDDILVVDDREATVAFNKNNAIIIPEFTGKKDENLLCLIELFKNLNNDVNLTLLNKKIF